MMMSCGVFKLQSLPAVLCGKLWFVGASTVKSVAVCRAAVNQQKRYFSLSTASGGNRPDEKLMVHFINRDNEKLTVPAKEGESLLDVVIKNNLDLDGFGACEGTLACSTCHIIFDKEVFENLDEITDEEMDMLDLAFGLTSTSKQDEEKWWECCCDPRLISKKCKPTRGMETDHDRRSDAPIPPHLKAADNILDVPEEWIQRHPCSVTSIRLMSQTTRSRLGCQICLKKSLDGITVKIPKEVSDVRESKGQ